MVPQEALKSVVGRYAAGDFAGLHRSEQSNRGELLKRDLCVTESQLRDVAWGKAWGAANTTITAVKKTLFKVNLRYTFSNEKCRQLRLKTDVFTDLGLPQDEPYALFDKRDAARVSAAVVDGGDEGALLRAMLSDERALKYELPVKQVLEEMNAPATEISLLTRTIGILAQYIVWTTVIDALGAQPTSGGELERRLKVRHLARQASGVATARFFGRNLSVILAQLWGNSPVTLPTLLQHGVHGLVMPEQYVLPWFYCTGNKSICAFPDAVVVVGNTVHVYELKTTQAITDELGRTRATRRQAAVQALAVWCRFAVKTPDVRIVSSAVTAHTTGKWSIDVGQEITVVGRASACRLLLDFMIVSFAAAVAFYLEVETKSKLKIPDEVVNKLVEAAQNGKLRQKRNLIDRDRGVARAQREQIMRASRPENKREYENLLIDRATSTTKKIVTGLVNSDGSILSVLASVDDDTAWRIKPSNGAADLLVSGRYLRVMAALHARNLDNSVQDIPVVDFMLKEPVAATPTDAKVKQRLEEAFDARGLQFSVLRPP
ncbi:MAG: hypothetical protein ACPGR8_16700, partial [Limisphaerales bacterium]